MSVCCIGIVILAAIVGTHGQGSLPDGRWGQATTVLNNTLLIHGGKQDPTNSYSYSSAPNIAELLSLDLSSSFSLSSPPWTVLNTTNAPAVAFHTLTPFSNHQLLLFGGDPGPADPLSTQNDSAAVLDLATGGTGTWTLPPDGWAGEPMRRQYHSATVYNSQAVITGGEKVDGSDYGFTDSYLFSPNPNSTPTFAQLPEMNSSFLSDFVGHAALTLPNGTILLLGGYSHMSHSLRSLKSVYTLDIASGTWAEVPTIPEPTSTPSTTALPDPLPTSDPGPDTETSPDPTPDDGEGIPARRRNFAAVLVGNDQILIHGGADAELQQAIGDAFILQLSSCQWKQISNLSEALGNRWGHSAVAIGTSVLFAYGYTGNGSASNALVLYDTVSKTLLSSFTPSPTSTPPNVNFPPATGTTGGGTGGGSDPHTTGGSGTGTGTGTGDGNTDGPSGSQGNGGQGSGENKTPTIVGGIIGGLVAAALIIVVIVLYRQRQSKGRGYRRRTATDDSEKSVMMLGGFEAVPPGHGYGFFARLFHLRPTPRYTQKPGRERFDILADEDASFAAIGTSVGPRVHRNATGESGSTYGAGTGGYFNRWSSFGDAVNASVGSLRSALGFAPAHSPVRQDEYLDLGNSTSRRSFNASSAFRPLSAWRRESSYATTNPVDPFGDENGVEGRDVEEEYQRAMMMQHEALRRASSSGADDYSALVLDGRKRGTPLEPVPSISTVLSSHSREELDVPHGRVATSDTTHLTSLRTPEINNAVLPRVYSPPLVHGSENSNLAALQRTTSAGSKIGASLNRALSAVSSLFSSPPPPYGAGGRSRRVSGAGSRVERRNAGYEYMDLRDPNPPPPMLGLGLVPIEESHATRRTGSSVEFDSSAGSRYGGRPPLVLKPLHGKSLSSLRTANSEALERLGTGHWDVVQRDGTGSSRRTEGSNTTGSDVADPSSGGGGWADVVGKRETVESPGVLDTPYEQGAFWNDQAPRATGSPAGPRPIPPPKRVATLAERIEALGKTRAEALSPQEKGVGPSDEGGISTQRPQALYGIVPKATLYVANPGKKPTDAS